MNTTRCIACNRPLRSAASIAAGYGPTCLKKAQAGKAPAVTLAERITKTAQDIQRETGGPARLVEIRARLNTPLGDFQTTVEALARDPRFYLRGMARQRDLTAADLAEQMVLGGTARHTLEVAA